MDIVEIWQNSEKKRNTHDDFPPPDIYGRKIKRLVHQRKKETEDFLESLFPETRRIAMLN